MKQETNEQVLDEERIINEENEAFFGTHIREVIREFRDWHGKQRMQKGTVRRR